MKFDLQHKTLLSLPSDSRQFQSMYLILSTYKWGRHLRKVMIGTFPLNDSQTGWMLEAYCPKWCSADGPCLGKQGKLRPQSPATFRRFISTVLSSSLYLRTNSSAVAESIPPLPSPPSQQEKEGLLGCCKGLWVIYGCW